MAMTLSLKHILVLFIAHLYSLAREERINEVKSKKQTV